MDKQHLIIQSACISRNKLASLLKKKRQTNLKDLISIRF